MTSPLEYYRQAWRKKAPLRRVYNDIYDRIAYFCVPGVTVEIGGGIGQFKQRFPDLIATDIQLGPGLDLVADAQKLPFADGSISNIVMLDVVHHVEYPVLFLRETERVLRPGGRCIMVEPAITYGSSFFYRFVHQEPVRMRVDPFAEGLPSTDRDPYDSNQAIPTLLVTRHRARLPEKLPSLSIHEVQWFSFLAYPLSGGFKSWSLLTDGIARRLLGLEKSIEHFLGSTLGFRVLIVLEKWPAASELKKL
jgi:SAM-dependent methyltransferase